MAALLDKINQDLAAAVKSRDNVTVSTLRMLLSNLHNAQIAKGSDLTDDEVLSEIVKDAKRHNESIESFTAGGRGELADREKAELAVLSKYLPEQLSDEELENMVVEAISAVGAKSVADMGRVVGAVLESAGARASGAKVAEIAKLKLTPNAENINSH